MHHKATIKQSTQTATNAQHGFLPVNIQCACGTGGDFGSKEEAAQWMARNHFNSLAGVSTAEIVDTIPEPEKVEEFPIHPAPEFEPATEVAAEIQGSDPT
jgi:hypothetical protein